MHFFSCYFADEKEKKAVNIEKEEVINSNVDDESLSFCYLRKISPKVGKFSA